MKFAISVILLMTLTLTACRNFVEIGSPKTEVDIATVFGDDRNATAAISSLYRNLSSSTAYMSMYIGMSADEYQLDGDIQAQFINNALLPTNPYTSSWWKDGFRYIYMSNAILEGLQRSANVTPALKRQLEGEAKFMRALNHLYLVNMYGDIPYITITDYEKNNLATRTPAADVYTAIVKDLQEARELLSDNYPTAERVRICKWAAAALLARAHMYTHEWASAESQASDVIGRTSTYELMDDLNGVFKRTSREAILQLMLSPSYPSTTEGGFFINPYILGYGQMTHSLAHAFEPGDLRYANWTGAGKDYRGDSTWRYPFKYKENYENATGSEYTMILRLSEQYLIRAEARARQGKLTGPNSAASDIDSIRIRAGLPPTTAITETQILAAITQERRVELFTELGDRWFDLKRKKEADAWFSSIKPGWSANDTLYPIPEEEILLNTRISQNKGY